MPIDLSWTCESGAQISRWHITESIDALSQKYKELGGDWAKIVELGGHVRHKLAARILIGQAFPNHSIVYGSDGKPLLSPFSAHINHSHAGDYAILAVHPRHAMGIDIEETRPQLHKIYPRFCNDKEQEWLGPNPSILHLLLIWSAKESLYKAIGKKKTDFKAHLLVYPFDVKNKGFFEAEIILPDLHKICKIYYQCWETYVAVWTCLG
ncbi:MAG: hypothetical protein CK532_07460 [Flavobacteriales bacterium]|nr:MAG: hypothetical protein CK532_07460 [Flavobacteriales bacterium]